MLLYFMSVFETSPETELFVGASQIIGFKDLSFSYISLKDGRFTTVTSLFSWLM
jgi:hypothetical protein